MHKTLQCLHANHPSGTQTDRQTDTPTVFRFVCGVNGPAQTAVPSTLNTRDSTC